MKVVVAIDSFKGCMTSAQANAAARDGVCSAQPDAEVVMVPVSDGGEGWIDAFRSACGGVLMQAEACDPLLRPIQAHYLELGSQAVVEVAQACGLTLLRAEERNPLRASTYGVGQLIAYAYRHGCTRFLVGLGGSATSDAGQGMLEALGSLVEEMLKQNCQFSIATDVCNPLYGPNGAAAVFAPQKGATPAMVHQLDQRARTFAHASALRMGFDCSNRPGAGAAGGLGYAFMQYLGAQCQPGIDLLLDTIGFDALLADADVVITGEGAADRQTLMGKVPMGILSRARRHQVPTLLVAGQVADREALVQAGFSAAININDKRHLPLTEAMQREVAEQQLKDAVAHAVKELFKAPT